MAEAAVRHLLSRSRGLREELAAQRQLMAAWLAAMDPEPQVSLGTARQWAAQARADGYTEGWDAGAVAGVAALKAQQHDIVTDWRAYLRCWHVCCRECRRAQPGARRCERQGCRRCQVRTRETYGLPHPDDYPGQP
jgi:hypothetical protein